MRNFVEGSIDGINWVVLGVKEDDQDARVDVSRHRYVRLRPMPNMDDESLPEIVEGVLELARTDPDLYRIGSNGRMLQLFSPLEVNESGETWIAGEVQYSNRWQKYYFSEPLKIPDHNSDGEFFSLKEISLMGLRCRLPAAMNPEPVRG